MTAAGAPTPFSDLVRWRRDLRRFKTDPVAPGRLERLLALADLSPSVGNSQPWRIVRVEDAARRAAVRQVFEAENDAAAQSYPNIADQQHYRSLKLAGFDAAPVHIAVFCDGETGQGRGLGRQTMPEMLAYSCVCMITTLWYAAQDDGLGMGWVSILDPGLVVAVLEVPREWTLIGYLLLGEPEESHLDPELERHGWQVRTQTASRALIR